MFAPQTSRIVKVAGEFKDRAAPRKNPLFSADPATHEKAWDTLQRDFKFDAVKAYLPPVLEAEPELQ